MAQGFRVRYRSMDGTIQGDRMLTQVPIRLGRNPLNHCQLGQPYISDFHASIELLDGRLCVRDLRSRNGVYTPAGERLPADVPVPIDTADNTFIIGRVVHVQVEVLAQARDAFARLSATRGEVLGNRAALEGGKAGAPPPANMRGPAPAPAVAPLPPLSMAMPSPFVPDPSNAPLPPGGRAGGRREEDPGINALPPLSMDPGSLARPPLIGASIGQPPGSFVGWPGGGASGGGAGPSIFGGAVSVPGGPSAFEGTGVGLPPLAPVGRDAGFTGVSEARREPSRPPERGSGPGAGGAGGGRTPSRFPDAVKSTQAFGNMNVETLALAGLRELAASLSPGSPLESTGDVARLVTKVHDTIEMFCRCFVPLRETYGNFVSSMHLQQAAMQRSLNRSPTALQVERARDPASLAAALVDFRSNDYDPPVVIEGVFTDLIVHQMALFEGVMRGVQALLAELSPAQIEARVAEAGGASALFGKQRAFWQTYQQRFEEVSRDAAAFERIFGGEFAAAYRDYQARSKDTQG